MNDAVERLAACGRLFAGHLAGDVAWSDPTPCRGWDVRNLVNHLTSEMLWAPPLVAGGTIPEVGDRFDGDVVGADPAASFTAAHDSAVAAFSAAGSTPRLVHLSYGDVAAEFYCDELALDALLHSWDLAKAVGDDDELPAELVLWALPVVVSQQEQISASGLYGGVKPFDPDGPPQNELLARLGRRR